MKWLLTGILLLLGRYLPAQEFLFKTYTTRDGLSNNEISAILQDQKGFLWIGTANGLNRFDGNAFDCFYHDPRNTRSLPSNQVQSIFIDSRQRLWVGSIGGISLFDNIQQQFTTFFPDSSIGRTARWFTCINEDQHGQLWVGSWHELLIFHPATNRFERSGWTEFAAKFKPLSGNNNRVLILNLLQKSANELWVLTTYGLYSVNTSTREFSWYPYEQIDDYYGCQLSHVDEMGDLWMGTFNKGLVRFNTHTKKWSAYTPPTYWNSIKDFYWSYGIVPYAQDTLLYAGLDGMILFDKKNNEYIRQYRNEPGNGKSYPTTRVFLTTKSGNSFWLASSTGLIQMYRPRSNVRQYHPFGNHSYINRVYPISPDGNELLLFNNSTPATIIWNEKENTAQSLLLPNGQPLQEELTGWFKLSNSSGLLSTDDHLYRLDLVTRRLHPLLLPSKRFADHPNEVRNMVIDRNGHCWLRLREQGVVRFDTISYIPSFVDILPANKNMGITSIYYDPLQHAIWLGTEEKGVYQYLIAQEKTIHHILRTPHSNNSVTISSITGDGLGHIYFGDSFNGMLRYTLADGSLTLFGRQEGMPGNNCHNLLSDAQGKIWVVTGQGIARFDPITQHFSHVMIEDDQLVSNGFISAAENGDMITSLENSYYKWNRQDLPGVASNAVIYLRSIRINQVPMYIDSQYEFDHLSNNILLQFGSIQGDREMPVLFEYALNSDSSWWSMEKSNTVNFSNLAPGHYVVKVRQKGGQRTLTLRFRIVPPFWRTGWFFLLVLGIAIVCTTLLVKRRIASVRKQALLKQKIAETEMMALRAQMNPHFIFNCISSIDNFIQDNDRENASAWLSKFARLIRSILESSKNELVPFWKDWETLRLYLELEQLRSDNKFRFEMKADQSLLDGHYRIPPLVIQPYVENAIHHGLSHRLDKEGVLTIKAILLDQQLQYIIEDNGIGREKAGEINAMNRLTHHSYGMQISKERIELFNRTDAGGVNIVDLQDHEGNATGTLLEIILCV